MELTLLAALLGTLIGLTLALTGAGGGVLSIPLLVFVLHLPIQQAAPVGLMAVGAAALLGAALGLRKGIVRYRAALLIGSAGLLMAPLGVFIAQRLPNRPLLAVFSLILATIGVRTLRHPATNDTSRESALCHVSNAGKRLNWTLRCARVLGLTGAVSGLLSGLLGVGGGFVIIPALTRYSDLDIRSIQATSLAVIALVSLSAVSASALHGSIPWEVAIPFAAGAVMALAATQSLAKKLDPRILQQAFAWVCLAVALLMLARSLGWHPSP